MGLAQPDFVKFALIAMAFDCLDWFLWFFHPFLVRACSHTPEVHPLGNPSEREPGCWLSVGFLGVILRTGVCGVKNLKNFLFVDPREQHVAAHEYLQMFFAGRLNSEFMSHKLISVQLFESAWGCFSVEASLRMAWRLRWGCPRRLRGPVPAACCGTK